ncbi:DMP19 family protein [Micromonospora chalcea]
MEGIVPADAPPGVAKLAHVHRVFNAIMGGGFGFAMEVIERDEFERAIEGFRYLNLIEIADLLADLVRSYGESSYDERKEEAFDSLINESSLVLDAYRRKASEEPSEFGLA